MVYKLQEFQGASGLWYVGTPTILTKYAHLWHLPALVLDLPLTDFIIELQDKYSAEVYYKGNFVGYRWEKQSDMRKFKNAINKKAREINFIV